MRKRLFSKIEKSPTVEDLEMEFNQLLEQPVRHPRDLDERLPPLEYAPRQEPPQYDSSSSNVKFDEVARGIAKERPIPPREDPGKITAEVIRLSHEAAAEALTKLGSELSERVSRIELLKIEADETLKSCLDLAEAYREQGRKDSATIEETSKLNKEVQAMIETMRAKIRGET
jgi:hypothetical protein